MPGSVIVQLVFFLLVVAPIVSMFLAFLRSSAGTRRVARSILVLAWLLYGGVTAWCLWTGFFVKGTGVGVGNGVFVLIAIPVGVFAGILFSVWLAAVQHEQRHSLGSGWGP